ncbi:cysteine desulfurase [Sphingomonas vulcanisoli]|uniref:Cysteine desulfurase n=1 Tax=Sphingomonas vulcanisoli TaxID=1658060 RepID=A0ABX0TV88_9SPHN|nr:cysteine desulfurase family protein [Sphingomonas vulcanisoli]NIJ08375.1 cysteine desulfurase [Sphingomonas vulcanisoli]
MIYLDYQATTPLAPEAKAAMLPWLDQCGNPHSPHRPGREAKAAVELARNQIAAPFGPGGRLFFTGGATEAVNWAIKGVMAGAPPDRRKLVTIATEHACVLDSAAAMAAQGYEVVILPVESDGIVRLEDARRAIDDRTALVVAMQVNNEIGVLQPVELLGELAQHHGAVMLCDAVQGYGRIAPPANCDLIALSAHKIHGPKGIGALWVRDGLAPAPLLHGGGQEGGLRSGTLSPMLCAGFGAAAALAAVRIDDDWRHVLALADHARAGFRDAGWHVNGSRSRRYPGNLNLRRDGLDSARLISELRDIAFSAGSACASGSGRPSHVLRAIGLSDTEARASIRLGFGRYTTMDEIEEAVARINAAAAAQREWA